MKPSIRDLNENAHAYLTPTADRRVDQQLVGHIAEWVVSRLRGQRALELGVGDQIWTPKLVKRFSSVTTVDGSSALLEAMAHTLNEPGWRGVCDWFEDHVPDAPYDTVLATYVLEHVDDPGLILRRCLDWLKPGGQLVVVVPNAASLHRRLAVTLGMIDHPADLGDTDRRMEHRRVFARHEMEQIILASGFTIVEHRGLLAKLLPNSMLTGCSDDQLRAMVLLGLELPIEFAAALYFLAEKS